MKQWFWDTVPYARLHGTFWVEPDEAERQAQRRQLLAAAAGQEGGGADEAATAAAAAALDFAAWEDAFAQVAAKARATPAKAGPGAGKASTNIIDSKRAYNINILMGSKIKIPVSQSAAGRRKRLHRAWAPTSAVGAGLLTRPPRLRGPVALCRRARCRSFARAW